MKEISELNLPKDLRYTDDHEWANVSGEVVKVGISDYAQDQLGDIVFVELPEVGIHLRLVMNSVPLNLLRRYLNYIFLSVVRLLP